MFPLHSTETYFENPSLLFHNWNNNYSITFSILFAALASATDIAQGGLRSVVQGKHSLQRNGQSIPSSFFTLLLVQNSFFLVGVGRRKCLDVIERAVRRDELG